MPGTLPLPLPRAAARVRALLAVLAAAALAGCDGAATSITGTAGAPGIAIGIGEGAGGAHPSALVGRWSHVAYYRDAAGALHASETRWEFLSGGSVTRTVVTTNITYGLQDTEIREGAWTATATEIVVAFAAPAPGTARLAWRLDRSTEPPGLFLNDTRFVRAA